MCTTDRPAGPAGAGQLPGLPAWSRVLVVVAHPDDESFGLGAVIDGFVRRGATVGVHCLTRGEASTLGVAHGDLADIRARELREAGCVLGVTQTTLHHWPDGALDHTDHDALVADVRQAVDDAAPEGLLVFDPSGVTGHPDHATATRAALHVADAVGVPVLGWTLPAPVAARLNAEHGTAFSGHFPGDIDIVLPVSRERQRRAIDAHASQAVPGSALWDRLDLLGDTEHLRWLRPPGQP